MDVSISIIVAIYNRRDELTELLDSLLVQEDKDFEIIIVDDGSSVELLPVVDLYQGKLDIQYFKKQNSGPGLSRNYGAERAKNSWLVFLDSDVVVPRDYIKNIKNNLLSEPTDAFGGADKADENFSNLQKAISYSMTSVFTTGGIRGSKKSVSKFQPRSFNMGVNKAVFSAVRGFSDMRIGEDPDLSMRLWENGYNTCFYENIAVYHKRRTSLKILETSLSVWCCQTYSQSAPPSIHEAYFLVSVLVFIRFFRKLAAWFLDKNTASAVCFLYFVDIRTFFI